MKETGGLKMRWRAQIDPHLFCSCHFAFVWTHGPPSSPSSSSSSLLSPPPLPLLPASISLCRQPGSVTPTVPIRSHYTWPGCAVCWWRPNKNRNSAVKRTQNVKKKIPSTSLFAASHFCGSQTCFEKARDIM